MKVEATNKTIMMDLQEVIFSTRYDDFYYYFGLALTFKSWLYYSWRTCFSSKLKETKHWAPSPNTLLAPLYSFFPWNSLRTSWKKNDLNLKNEYIT